MFESFEFFGCRDGSFLKAVMANIIHNNMVSRSDESIDDPESSHPTGGEDKNVHVPIFRELILQLQKQPRL